MSSTTARPAIRIILEAAGWRLVPDLDARPDDAIVRKTRGDAFLGTRGSTRCCARVASTG